MRQQQQRPNTEARRRIALIGVAAILLQALLFGWHHHEFALGRSGPAATLSNASQPLAPASAKELCEICSILHHQSAAPLAFMMPAIPSSIESAINPPSAASPDGSGTSGFRARAPPLA